MPRRPRPIRAWQLLSLYARCPTGQAATLEIPLNQELVHRRGAKRV